MRFTIVRQLESLVWPPPSLSLLRGFFHQALERLDGCGNGQLTLDFVGAVAKSWPAGVASTADEALSSTG